MNEYAAGRCFATLLFRDNSTWQRRAFEEDEHMLRLWAKRLLNVTALPVIVMHQEGVDAASLLRDVDPTRRLQYQPVGVVLGQYWDQQPWYRLVHMKLHAWALPCTSAAFMDYDGVVMRNLDSVFDECGDEELCAVRDVVTPKQKGLRLPNAGMLVLRTNTTRHRQLLEAASAEGRLGLPRTLAEQGFLLRQFPNWKALPEAYNVPRYASRFFKQRPLVSARWLNGSFFLHEKLAFVPEALAVYLGIHPEWAALQATSRGCVELTPGLQREVLCGRSLSNSSRWRAKGANATLPSGFSTSKSRVDRTNAWLRQLGLRPAVW